MEETENNQNETSIQNNLYQGKRKSISKKKKIDSFVCKYTKDNSNDEDNEDSHLTEDSESVKSPPIKKRGRPKKLKGREYKVDDDDENNETKNMKKKSKIYDENNKNSKIRTRTTPTLLFNAMAILNVDIKNCLDEMGFGSMIGMEIHELPGKLGFYVIDNLNTKTNVLSLTDNSILVTSQSVHDILGIPMGGCSLESLEPRSPDDPFIKEWLSQFGDKNEDFIKMIQDKCYNVHQDLRSVRETLNKGLSRFPNYKKDLVRNGENDDTTATTNDKNDLMQFDSKMESDSPAYDDDNQKSVDDDGKQDVIMDEIDEQNKEDLCKEDNGDQTVEHNDTNEDIGNTDSAFVDIRDKQNNDDSELSNNDDAKSEKGEFYKSPYELKPIEPKIRVSASEKLVADTLFAMMYKPRSYKKLRRAKLEVVKLDFKKSNDHADCGIIVMTAMDCYMGKVKKLKDMFLEGIPYTQLVNLRQMIATKIMMSEINIRNDYDDSIDEVDPNIIVKEVVKDINKSSVEYTEDNSNDEDNEDSHSVDEEQNTEDSDSVKTPIVKKCGRPKKIVRDNENKTSSVKRRGRPRKNNDESKKQTISSKRKGREYKVEDDDDSDGTKRMKKKMDHKEAKVKIKRNQNNNKRKIVDESSTGFKVTTTSSKGKKHKKNIKIFDENKKINKIRTRTTPTTLFNAMALLNVDRKKCLYEMGFGSLIGMAIHELPGMLGFYVIDNLDTKTNVLSLTDNSILVNSQSVHDILEIPMGGCSLESLESRSPDDPFIKEWFSQFGDKNDVRPNVITDVIISTNDADKFFKMNFLMLFANTMGLCETLGVCNMNILKKIRDDVCIEKIDWCSYIIKCLKESKQKRVNPETHHYTGPLTFMIDYIKMIKEKSYNIHQDLISVRENLDEGLSRFPDCKKLNMFCKKFKETTTGIDNDDTTGIEKESDSPDCQMESDSPASDDDNQKSDFQVLFHKRSGNSYLQRMKNKERNEEVHHILNEDDKVNDSCPAAGVCSVIKVDEVKLSEDEHVEKEKQQIDNEDDRVVDDSDTTIPDYAIVHDSVERSEHTLEKEKKKISNEELRSKSLKGNVGVEDAVDSQHAIKDIFKQDEQIQSAKCIDNDDTTGIEKESDSPDCLMESDSHASDDDNQKSDFQVLFHKESGNSDLQRMNNKSPEFVQFEVDEVKLSEVEDVEKEKKQIGNEDDRVVDDSDTTILDYVTKGKGVKFIKNDNVLVDDVPNACDAVIQDENKAIVQDSVERSEHTLEKEKTKISNEELRSESLKDVGCSIPNLDDDKLDVYNGPDFRSPYEYLPVDVKKPASDVEKIVADTFFAMIGSKLDLIFESQSVFGLNHLEMETLTPTLMVYAYVIDVWAELLNILEIYKNESLPLRYFFKITVYRKVFVQYLYYVKHPKAEAIEKAKIKRMKMSWRTTRNSPDCESKKQNEQLNSLRSKFAAKIILSEFNLLREKFMKLVQLFEKKTEEERKKTIDDAIANKNHRDEI
nr:ulp1 protease family, C-terminal catalytic domain-containing protein [Tanacetum cinerariifolium]